MCREAAASELAARVTDGTCVQRRVCGLAVSRSIFGAAREVSGLYQALYRKYRLQTFDEVVGQQAVTQTLKNQAVSGRFSHAYLFTGTRGTGKTSCARILAKAVNCEDPQDGNPCNRCAACRSIDAGSCVDVIEIDAASNNGVDNVRALRDEAVYTPAEVKRRVYIIDEVHMLSGAAFNALLKTIEEPPEHLMFILATTELQKVPATILSRCQRFSFRRLTQQDIAARLNYVAYQEKIEIDTDAISLLARLGDGAMRDALSLLDQCAAAADGGVTAETVAGVLGLAGQRRTAELMGYIAAHDAARALTLFDALYAGGKDISAMADELATLARDLLILKTAPESGSSMLSGGSTDSELQSLLPRLTGAELLRIVSLLQRTTGGFARSANRRIDFELCLMELCAPELAADSASLSARLSRVEAQLAHGLPVQSTPAAAVEPAPPPGDEDTPPPPGDEDAPPARAPAPQQVSDRFWPELLAAVRAEAGPEFALYAGSLTGSVADGVLELTAASALIKTQLERDGLPELFRQKASAMLGAPLRLELRVRGAAPSGGDPFEDLIGRSSQLGGLVDIQ